ncbi:13307_t:CDS:2 [Ambispora gerdemannii]|uniref:13307_t:CDS:1 n=1 Tax=Ambispora gerdemannii TaxID=144530 RepID=A0A9N8Z6D5_9GLOM|nr:13307_t:CDS:2 [Ambispora gerdemannii]
MTKKRNKKSSKSNANKETTTQTQDDAQKLNDPISTAANTSYDNKMNDTSYDNKMDDTSYDNKMDDTSLMKVNFVVESKGKPDIEDKPIQQLLENTDVSSPISNETISDVTRNDTIVVKDLDSSQSDQVSNHDTIDVPTSDCNDEMNSYMPVPVKITDKIEIPSLDSREKKENLSDSISTTNFIQNETTENDTTTPSNISHNKIDVQFAVNGMSVHTDSVYETTLNQSEQSEHNDDLNLGFRSLPYFDEYPLFFENSPKANPNNRVEADNMRKIDKKHKQAQKTKRIDKKKQKITNIPSKSSTLTTITLTTQTSVIPTGLEVISPNMLSTRPFLLYNVAYYFDNLVERISATLERHIDRTVGLPIGRWVLYWFTFVSWYGIQQ